MCRARGQSAAVAFASSVLAPGSMVAGHRILGVIGRGAGGIVYQAEQLSLGRFVALKVLHAQHLRDPGACDAFLAEARAAASLDHPHLVTVHEAHAEPGVACYSMELIRGRTLDRTCRDQGPLPIPRALELLAQIADALAYAHNRGLVHRDVKPGNILLTLEGQAKLLDLGLVRSLHDGPAAGAASRLRLVVLGTPDFAAPEQMRDPSRAGPASDVWSLGATCFWLITGRTPFAGSTLLDLLIGAAADPLVIPPDLPTPCRDLLQFFLEKDPEDRPADGADAGRAIALARSGRSPVGTRPIQRTARRRPWRRAT
jgi:eukaryotic-like serine/threonine-protein kinase